MSADDKVIIPVEADLSSLYEATNKIAQAISGLAEAIEKKAVPGAKRTEDALDKLGRTGKKAATLPIPGMRAFGRTLDDIADAAELAVSPVGAAVLGIGTLGGAAVVAAGSVAALGAGTLALVDHATELDKAVAPFRGADALGFSAGATVGLFRAEAALDATKTTAAALALTFAEDLAPTVGRVGTLGVAAGLALHDAFVDAGGAVGVFRAALVGLVDGVLGPFVHALMPDLAESLVKAGFSEASDALDAMEGAAGGYLDRARELVGAQDAFNARVRAGKAAVAGISDEMRAFVEDVKALAEAEKKADEAQAKLTETIADLQAKQGGELAEIVRAHEKTLALVQAEVDAGASVTDAETARALILADQNREIDEFYAKTIALKPATEAVGNAWAQTLAQTREGRRAVEETLGGIVAFEVLSERAIDKANEDIENATTKREKKAAERHKRQAIAAFSAFKSVESAKILVEGEVAAVTALAELGPIAGPIAAAGIVAGTIAEAIATVTATSPQFHAGGATVDYPGPTPRFSGGPDETSLGSARVAAGERVQPMGGGESGVMRVELPLVLDGRVVDRLVYDVLTGRGKSGGLLRGIRRSDPVYSR